MDEQQKRSLRNNALAAAVLVLGIGALRGGFTPVDERHLLMSWADGVTLAAVLLLALAFLAWSARMGTLDAVAFGWSKMTKKKNKDTGEPLPATYFEYLQQKEEQRKNLPTLRPRFIVSGALLALAVVLNTVYAVLY